jgi:hypothetical protein
MKSRSLALANPEYVLVDLLPNLRRERDASLHDRAFNRAISKIVLTLNRQISDCAGRYPSIVDTNAQLSVYGDLTL